MAAQDSQSSDYFDDDTNLAMLQVANIHDEEVTEAGLLTDAENNLFLDAEEGDEVIPVPGDGSSEDVYTQGYGAEFWEAAAAEHDASEEPETSQGPPTTQATTGSASEDTRNASKASLISTKSLPVELESKGKKRGLEDESEIECRPSKVSKTRVASFPDTYRPKLRASTSAPVAGPSRGVSVPSVATPAPMTCHSRPVSAASPVKTHGPAPVADDRFSIIAHDHDVQKLFDGLHIAWGVQYEIARGITDGRWTWEDVTAEKLEKLKGPKNVQQAYRVPAVILGKPTPNQSDTEHDLWSELDREQFALVEAKFRGLGFPPSDPSNGWEGPCDWYGGQIQQIIRLTRAKEGKFSLTLCRMQKTRSHRFARYHGSRHILQMKIVDTRGDLEEEKKFLQQKFVLCGRFFVPFSVKDGKVYMLEIDEDQLRGSSNLEGDDHRYTLDAFVMCHNPIALNMGQPVAKWASRIDLGLSTSLPGIKFHPHDIEIIDDLHAAHRGRGKIPAEKILTDGCGFMNAAALAKVQEQLKLDDMPTAVQGRIFGSKGLWVLHPEPQHHSRAPGVMPMIWIRKSQQKIKLAETPEELLSLNQVHFIFDIVAIPRVSPGARLSKLSIINLAENRVPAQVFIDLMRQGLEREIAPLTHWEGEHAIQLLTNAVDKIGGVTASRMQTMAAGAQRALGLSRGFNQDADVDEVIGDDPSETLPATTRRLKSGKPPSVAGTVKRMLECGFNPAKEYFLFDQLDRLRDYATENHIMQYHVPVPMSLDAFIAPDTTGELQVDEICFTSSKPLDNPTDPWDPYSVTGDVLVFRNPARLPSDVRKVRAVRCPRLERHKDVIFFSTHGDHSLASELAGGDYDGDVAVMIYDPNIVKSFQNTKIYKMPAGFLESYFEPESKTVTVNDLQSELQRANDAAGINIILRKHLLHGLAPSSVGIYSVMHENAIYTLGYNSETTIRIAHMFNTLLDSRKSGLIVKKTTFAKDRVNHWCEGVQAKCMSEANTSSTSNIKRPVRDSFLPKFILDILHKAGQDLKKRLGVEHDQLRARLNYVTRGEPYDLDASIVKVHDECKELLSEDEWAQITGFVDQKLQDWMALWCQSPSKRKKFSTKAKVKEDKQVDNAKVRELVEAFARGPPFTTTNSEQLNRLYRAMAAYAYCAKPKFAFNVAFEELCTIKAGSDSVQVTNAAYSAMEPSRRAARIMARASSTLGPIE